MWWKWLSALVEMFNVALIILKFLSQGLPKVWKPWISPNPLRSLSGLLCRCCDAACLWVLLLCLFMKITLAWFEFNKLTPALKNILFLHPHVIHVCCRLLSNQFFSIWPNMSRNDTPHNSPCFFYQRSHYRPTCLCHHQCRRWKSKNFVFTYVSVSLDCLRPWYTDLMEDVLTELGLRVIFILRTSMLAVLCGISGLLMLLSSLAFSSF